MQLSARGGLFLCSSPCGAPWCLALDRPRYQPGIFSFWWKSLRGGKPFWKKVLPPRTPPFQKLLPVGLRKDKGGLRGTPASTSILFCQFVVPCSFASRDKASIAAYPAAYPGRSSGRPPPVREYVSGPLALKNSVGLRGGRGLPARAAQVIHAGRAHPPAWEMADVRRKGRGTAVGRSSRAGKECSGEQRPKGHCPGSCRATLRFFILR